MLPSSLLLVLLAAPPQQSAPTVPGSLMPLARKDQRAVLDLTVNEKPAGQVLVVIRDGDVLVRSDVLERADVRTSGGRWEDAGDDLLLSLSSLAPGVSFVVDEKALALRVTADPQLFGTTRLDLSATTRPAFVHGRAPSAFANYGFEWRQSGGEMLSTEAGVSAGGILFSTTTMWSRDAGLRRGLSSITIDQRKSLTRVTIGDSFAGDRLLGSTALVGGIRVAREYGIDPYFVQYPMLGLAGAATTPSTVEVYVDGRLVRQERVQPGRFELANVPVPHGSSETKLVVRDAFGREQETLAPYYLATSVLAPGLHDYEYALGFDRGSYGGLQGGYGKPLVMARHRYGFNDFFTGGARLEARAGTLAGGPGANFRTRAGEIEIAAAASRSMGKHGAAFALGYAWSGQPVSGGFSIRGATANYTPAVATTMPARLELAVYASTRIGRLGTFTVQRTEVDPRWGWKQARTSVHASSRLSDRWHVLVSASRVRREGRTGHEIAISIGHVIGRGTRATLSASSGGGRKAAALEVQRSLPVGNGYGYRVRAAAGDARQGSGRFTYQGAAGRYEVAQEASESGTGSSFSVSGGVVAIGGSVHATRPVQEAFALLRVPGVEGVRGYVSNEEVGRTDRRGDLFIPNLLPYYANRVSIADEDVPVDYSLEVCEQAIAPPFRGGALVVFAATEVRNVTGSVVLDVDGKAVVPEFADLEFHNPGTGTRASSPIGRGGRFYLENLAPGHYVATVRYGALVCSRTVEVPAAASPVTDIGLVRCRVEERQP